MPSERRIMREFRLDEISAVDDPAQKGARATIMKRDFGKIKIGDKIEFLGGNALVDKINDEDDPMVTLRFEDDTKKTSDIRMSNLKKSCELDEYDERERRKALTTVMTDATDGHAHLVDISRRAGETSWTRSDGDENGHSHPFMLNPDGSVNIGEADGHTHNVDTAQLMTVANAALGELSAIKSMNQETGMTDEEIKALEKRAERAESINKLSVEQRSHFDALEGDDKETFLGKSDEDRQKISEDAVAKAKAEKEDSDPIVYKSDDGTQFRKSDDPRFVDMAKRADESERKLAKERATNAQAGFEKRAEADLSHFPGDVSVRAAILKAVDGISDEKVKGEAHSALKAQDAKLGKSFTVVGVSTGADLNKAKDASNKSEAEAELEKLANKRAEDESEDFVTAYTKVAEANPELAKRAIG